MADVSLDRQFIGQARLVRLLLWKIGDTTEVDQCMQLAKESGMINDDDAEFLTTCLEAEESGRESGEFDAPFTLSSDNLVRLRRCADKLNRADSA